MHLLLIMLLIVTGCGRARSSHAVRPDSAFADSVGQAPVVRGPTVVAFWLQASDTLAGGEGADLVDKFRDFTARVAPALDGADIALVATTADSIVVELQGGPRRVISLRGLDYPFGYVLVEPGYAETILTGVSTDDELLEEVTWYFGLDEADPDSVPGRVASVSPRSRGEPLLSLVTPPPESGRPDPRIRGRERGAAPLAGLAPGQTRSDRSSQGLRSPSRLRAERPSRPGR